MSRKQFCTNQFEFQFQFLYFSQYEFKHKHGVYNCTILTVLGQLKKNKNKTTM